jgi:hypothetical protein
MIAGYAKSGNTWLQHILYRKLIGSNYDSDKAIDLIKPNIIMYRTEGLEIPKRKKLIYILRHPLDILVSYRNYQDITGRNNESFDNYVNNFLNEKGIPGRNPWMLHIDFWKKHTNCIITYDDLMFRGEKTLKILFDYLELDSDTTNILEDVSFKSLRDKEDLQAKNKNWNYFRKQRPTNIKAIQDNKRFYNVGKSFYFPELLNEEQIKKGFSIFKPKILEYWPNEELTKRYIQ